MIAVVVGRYTQIAFLALRVFLSARRALGRKHKPSLSVDMYMAETF